MFVCDDGMLITCVPYKDALSMLSVIINPAFRSIFLACVVSDRDLDHLLAN